MTKERITIVLKNIKPTPLNRLYVPVIKNGKPTIIISKEGRETKKLLQMEVLRQRQNKMLDGSILFYMDIEIKKRKSPDIDALLKQLFDAFQGLCYKNDKDIDDLRVRKHYDCGEDMITILIEKIE